MNAKKLIASKHIDIENGFLCRYVRSNTERFVCHYHEYYEIFMVVKGPVCHVINSKNQILEEGNLLFIRDFDQHDFVRAGDDYFEFLNLAISKDLLMSVFEYLGSDYPVNNLLKPKDPPTVSLSTKEREKLFYSLVELDTINNRPAARLKVKSLLTELFVNYFFDNKTKTTNVPSWLELTYEKMKNPKYFIEGASKMQELSGKTREHLTRSMQTYYNISPTEYVNDLRLEYSAKLLTRSNLPILDVCYSCGFDNLSWFYKIFSKKFGTTPSKYRKKYETIEQKEDFKKLLTN